MAQTRSAGRGSERSCSGTCGPSHDAVCCKKKGIKTVKSVYASCRHALFHGLLPQFMTVTFSFLCSFFTLNAVLQQHLSAPTPYSYQSPQQIASLCLPWLSSGDTTPPYHRFFPPSCPPFFFISSIWCPAALPPFFCGPFNHGAHAWSPCPIRGRFIFISVKALLDPPLCPIH